MLVKKPYVSVIIIYYNAERFLEEAILSVFAQSYNEWELLLIDDGSTDESTNIGRRYASAYADKVSYFEHPDYQNRGMSASRNLGIEKSRGEYIAFLDADDVYLPQKLERQVAILDAQPAAGMVYGATEHWYSWTGKREDAHRDVKRRLGIAPDTLVQPPTLIPLFLRSEAQTPGICGILVRRQVIQQVGGFEVDFRGMFEDQVFIYKICLRVPVYIESGSWDRYRQHSGSHTRVSDKVGTHARDGSPSPAHRRFVQWLESFLVEQRVTDREVWQAFRRQTWPYRHPRLYELLTKARRAREMLLKMKFLPPMPQS